MWRSLSDRLMGRRLHGRPPSGNGASSFHLVWLDVPPALEASVELEVVSPPAVDRLYFWALQASFSPGGGGAHLGLQWNPRHAGGRAVNWGGYDPRGSVLTGTDSPLVSSVDDPNTRTWPWRVGRRYRLRIHRGPQTGWWAGEVTDLVEGGATRIRELGGGGETLEGLVVWSEVFADCDAPPVEVRWSRPRALLPDGRLFAPAAYSCRYQGFAQGGCTNTDSRRQAAGVVQLTGVARTNPAGTRLPA
jgi:hypothetical protein